MVHGGYADSVASFGAVIPSANGRGLARDAAPNPLRGSVLRLRPMSAVSLKVSRVPIVLVGHSYGGMVITNAATGNPNVKALKFTWTHSSPIKETPPCT